MKSLNLLLATLLVLLYTNIQSQTPPNTENLDYCGIEKANKIAFEAYPDLKDKSKTTLKNFNRSIQNRNGNSNVVGDLVPVVFHLITPCENSFTFSKADLEQALIEVNEDFNAQNTYEYNSTIDPIFFQDQADIGISFALAEIDPFGNPTDGITHSNSYFSNQGSTYQVPLKDINQWDPTRYLNVWIVDNVTTSGYAQYPWTAVEYPNLDGIVMSYDYIGENNVNNRPNILTHEIGHWLGLLHTWGDFTTEGSCADPAPTYCECDDFIDDTPNCLGLNSLSCPSNLPNTCTDAVNDRPDNIYNFMDYACEVMFTEDQKTRMLQTVIDGIAGRDEAVTTATDPDVFMASNPDNNDAKLYLDRYVFTESFNSPGTVTEVGILELRDCPTCTFSSNINNSFTITGLPANIANSISITLLNSTNAMISFDFELTNFVDHDATADFNNFSINFNANAINGINQTSQVFNNASIEGLKIDFIDNYPNVLTTTFTPGELVVQNLSDGEYAGAFMPFLNDHVSFYHYQNAFYLYSATSYQMEAAVTGTGSYNVKRFTGGELLNTEIFQPVTSGIYDGLTELVLYDPNSYTAWQNQTGYVGIKVIMTCGEEFYVWVGISFINNELTIIDVGINSFPNDAFEVGQFETCLPNLTLVQDYNSQENILYDVTDWISSTSDIASDADIAFEAGNYIELEDGFTVDLGATFSAEIEGCQCLPATPLLYDLSHEDYCTYGYLQCNFHEGDMKEFELHNLSNGNITSYTTIDHFQFVNFNPSNNYQFRVRKQCSSSSIFGGWSPFYSFSIDPTGCGGCVPAVPVIADLSHTENCTNGYLYCNNHTGDNKEFELQNLSNGTITTYTTIEYYQFVNLDPNANYQFRVRLQCGTSGSFGSWSPYHSFSIDPAGCGGCVPDVPVLADLTHDDYCTYGYLYCFNYTGDNKEYELHNLSSGAITSYTTVEHYQSVPLNPNDNYQYRVRLQCGTTGSFGGWSPFYSFVIDPAGCGGCVPNVPVSADLSHDDYCTYGYLYCNNHTGDNKEYELQNLTNGSTTSYITLDHFQSVNLDQNTNYQFRVRLQCGTVGNFGSWSPYHSFSSCN